MKTEFVIVDIDGTVAKATFSTESRVRNLMCVDYYGTPIQDLRKSLKLK